MGLVFDIKKKFKVENYRQKQTKQMKMLTNGFIEEDSDLTVGKKLPKAHILAKMEAEANAPKESKFKLPKVQVKELGYFIEKYGLNYKLWVKDHKNYDQLTWRQYRAKCRKFMNIPEQFGDWLDEKGIFDKDVTPNDPKWKEYSTDDE